MVSHALRASLAILMVCGGAARAVSISGNATTSLFLSDRPTVTDQPLARMPLYQSLTFLLGDMAGGRLSFEGNLRGWRDLKGEASDRGDLRLYRAVLRWRDPARGLEVGFGRQRVSEGVGRAYLDGAFARWRRGALALSAFLGQPLRLGLDRWERWDGSALQWGTRAQWRPSARLRVGVSYTEMRHEDRTGLRLIGANALLFPTERQTIRLRTDVDAVENALDQALASWTFQPDRWRLYGLEVQYRQARLWAFSPLAQIGKGGFTRIISSAVHPLRGDLRFALAAGVLNAGGGVGGTADVAIWWRTLRVGYLFASTESVLGSGLYLQGSYRINSLLRVGGRSNWTRYETDEADASAQAIGSAAFLTLTPLRGLEITGELHQITNDRYTYQLEGLLVLRYRFEKLAGR